jgi:prophage tail gpP-like protein
MVLVVPVTPTITPPLPPERPAGLGLEKAPIPPERPKDLGKDAPQQQPAKPREGFELAQKPPGGPLDIVTLLVNGKQYGGWEKATITASMDDATRAFSVTTSEHPPDWPIKPQDEVTVYVNYNDMLCKGFVETYSAELSESTHVARIDGASFSADAADSAAGTHEPGPDQHYDTPPAASGDTPAAAVTPSTEGGRAPGPVAAAATDTSSDSSSDSEDDGGDDGQNESGDETGRYRNQNIKQIGESISKDHPNIKFVDKTSKGLKNIERFQLQQGETIHDAVERIARSENLYLVGGADGSIEIHDGPEKMSKVALVEGYWPVLKISVKITTKDRFQTTKVRGQRAHSDKAEDLKVEATVKDKSVKRKRTKVIIAEGDIDTKKARARALNDLNKQQGDGTTATVECSGFYAPDGKLWRPLQLVYVNFPTVHLDQTMGIKSIVWNKEENSKTYTRLELVDPKAMNGEGDDKSKSGKVYDAGPDKGYDQQPPTPTNPPEEVTPSTEGGRAPGRV